LFSGFLSAKNEKVFFYQTSTAFYQQFLRPANAANNAIGKVSKKRRNFVNSAGSASPNKNLACQFALIGLLERIIKLLC